MSEDEILHLIDEGKTKEDYLDNYCKLVDNALKRGLNKSNLSGYYEKHHILPRCLGGENENYNYVLFTSLEHIVAHILLYYIYDDNLKIIYSADCMLTLKSYSTIDREKSISKIDLKLISELREKRLSIRKKKIICYFINDRNDLEILSIYNSISSTADYGLCPSVVGEAVRSETRKAGGYNWDYLDNFAIKYPELLENFISNNTILTKNIKFSTKNYNKCIAESRKKFGNAVVCFNPKTFEVLWIYDFIQDAKKDGFSEVSISRALNNPQKRNTIAGYGWMLYHDFINNYPEAVEKFLNLENKIKPIPMDNRVACLNDNFEIVKIYENLLQTKNDGFKNTAVCNSIKTKKKYCGYFWDKYVNVFSNKRSNEKLKKTRSNEPLLIVNCDISGNIKNIYSSCHNIPDIPYQSIFGVINRENKLYKGSYWCKLSDYINKFSINNIKEYEREKGIKILTDNE